MADSALAQPVQLYSAGSLKGAWLDMIEAFGATTGIKVQPRFGASGLLKDASSPERRPSSSRRQTWSVRKRWQRHG